MRDRVPTLIAFVLLVALVIGTWWAAGYAQRAIPFDPPRRVTHEPDSWADQFVMVRTDEQGVPINRLEGVYMQHYPDDDSYKVTTAKAIGQQPGSPITIGTSKVAIMDQGGSRIVMQGDAHLHRLPDADRAAMDVTSQQLTLLPDKNVAFTDLPALVINGNSTLHGKGMRYDNNTRDLQVYSATDVKISGRDAENQKTLKPSRKTKP